MIRSLLIAALTVVAPAVHAEVTVQGRDGPVTFETVPERVVVLDWALAAQMLDLDIPPAGAPELDLYREWVGAPEMPAQTVDVGLRTEPNLERIDDLGPDVILAADIDAGQADRLNRIAPTVVFESWSDDHDNVAAARDTYLALAGLFEREDLAQERIAAQETRLDEIATEVADMDLPDKATAIRLNDGSSVWIYGDNSFPRHALRRMGLAPEIDLPASRWGVTQRPIDALAEVDTGLLLAIRPHMGGAAALDGPLWSALPAVRALRFEEVEPVWSYGGFLDIGRHAERFLDALQTLRR